MSLQGVCFILSTVGSKSVCCVRQGEAMEVMLPPAAGLGASAERGGVVGAVGELSFVSSAFIMLEEVQGPSPTQ